MNGLWKWGKKVCKPRLIMPRIRWCFGCTVWSVNDGLFGNLRKPLRPVYITKTYRKPAGNLPKKMNFGLINNVMQHHNQGWMKWRNCRPNNYDYRKVINSRPVYFSILITFDQRSQYTANVYPIKTTRTGNCRVSARKICTIYWKGL